MSVKIKTMYVNPMGHKMIEEIKGTPIEIPGYEDLEFVFHKLKTMGGYGITEVRSGIQMIDVVHFYCKNKKAAVDAAQICMDGLIHKHNKKMSDLIQCKMDEINDGNMLNDSLGSKKKKRGCDGQLELFENI